MSVAPASKVAKIAVIYYSLYGHINTMAKSVAKGVVASGSEATLLQIPELLTAEQLTAMHAAPKDTSVPFITDVNDLKNYDGFIFGFPTRFGTMPGQVKMFYDSLGGLWQQGAFIGKTVSVFTCTGTQAGGSESTHLTSVPVFAALGLIYVPMGGGGPSNQDGSKISGGTLYGASSFAGSKGHLQPSELELSICEYQGKHVSEITRDLKVGLAEIKAAAPATESK